MLKILFGVEALPLLVVVDWVEHFRQITPRTLLAGGAEGCDHSSQGTLIAYACTASLALLPRRGNIPQPSVLTLGIAPHAPRPHGATDDESVSKRDLKRVPKKKIHRRPQRSRRDEEDTGHGKSASFAANFESYDRSDCLPMIAIYLLAEWEVTESLQTVFDCFALDEKYGGYELGDLITEDGPVILEQEAKRDQATCLRQNVDRFRRIVDTAESISYWGRWERQSALQYSSYSSSKLTPAREASPNKVSKVGRNEPCPCGSGKKYKNCCGRFAQ